MIGFGAKKDDKVPITMVNGYSPEIFREFEKFDNRLEIVSKDWFLHIFYKESGEEVAVW